MSDLTIYKGDRTKRDIMTEMHQNIIWAYGEEELGQESVLLSIYAETKKKNERVPTFFEISQAVGQYNYGHIYDAACEIFDLENEGVINFEHDEGVEELAADMEEEIYSSYISGHIDVYIQHILRRRGIAYIVDDAEELYGTESFDVLLEKNITVVANDCQNIIFHSMTIDGLMSYGEVVLYRYTLPECGQMKLLT